MYKEWAEIMTDFVPDEMLSFTVEKNSEEV